jgi:hypothetical protein
MHTTQTMQTTSQQPHTIPTSQQLPALAISRTSPRQALHVQQVSIAGGDHMLLKRVTSLEGWTGRAVRK